VRRIATFISVMIVVKSSCEDMPIYNDVSMILESDASMVPEPPASCRTVSVDVCPLLNVSCVK
jgi:hypothetical protein